MRWPALYASQPICTVRKRPSSQVAASAKLNQQADDQPDVFVDAQAAVFQPWSGAPGPQALPCCTPKASIHINAMFRNKKPTTANLPIGTTGRGFWSAAGAGCAGGGGEWWSAEGAAERVGDGHDS